jgi:hypothetical protein
LSRKHPQNGPSLSDAPSKKQKPMTDQELAGWNARQAAGDEQKVRDAATSREFQQIARKEGFIAALNYLRRKRGVPPFKAI